MVIGVIIKNKEVKPLEETRINQVKVVCNAYRKMLKDANADCVCVTDFSNPRIGVVTVLGKNIAVLQPGWFASFSKLATNLEIYPRTDGLVQMNLTFYNKKTIEH